MQLLWKRVGWVLKKLNRELAKDPTIPLLNMYLEEMKAETGMDIRTPVFIASFTIVKR